MKRKKLCLHLCLVFLPVIVGSTALSSFSCRPAVRYGFEGMMFDSEKDVFRYAEKKLKQETEFSNQDKNLLSLVKEHQKEVKALDPFHSIDQKINELIKEEKINHDQSSPEITDGSKAASTSNTISVYRSSDGGALLEEEKNLKFSALKTCASNKLEFFLYRDSVIQNEQHLQRKIKENGFRNDSKYLQIISKSTDGKTKFYSCPIFLDYDGLTNSLKNKDWLQQAIRFLLRTYSNVIYSVKRDNKVTYYKNIDQFIDQFEFNRSHYLYLPENKMRSGYVFDIKKNNQHDYYGPYATNGELGITQIEDQKLWHSVPNLDVDWEAMKRHQENVLVSEFFDFLVPDIPLDQTNIFNILLFKNESDGYKNFMLRHDQESWKSFLNLSTQLDQGQRRSILFKIPVMYSFISEVLAAKEIFNEAIFHTNLYFGKILQALNDLTELVFPPEIFKHPDVTTDEKFSLELLFEKPEMNSPASVPSYQLNVQQVKKKYPYFLPAVKLALFAIQNRISLNGNFPYSTSLLESMFESQVSLTEELKAAFTKIWNTFSAKRVDDFMGELKQSDNKTITLGLTECALKIQSLSNAISEEYRRQVEIVLKDPKQSSNCSFFKNVTDYQKLINAAVGDYGMFLILKHNPTLLKNEQALVQADKNETSVFKVTKSFFEIVKSSIDISQKILPSVQSFTNLLGKVFEGTKNPSLRKFFYWINTAVDKLSSPLAKEICGVFSDISSVAIELNNLIHDVWNKNKSIEGNVNHFLKTNYFIDNNPTSDSKDTLTSKIDHNHFLKKLMPPIKISKPRLKSEIYVNGKTYPDNESGLRNAKYEFISYQTFLDLHQIDNVKVYYTLEGTDELIRKLNSNETTVQELAEEAVLHPSIFKLLEQFMMHLENVSGIVSERSNYYNPKISQYFRQIPNYEKEILNWKLAIYPLPTSDHYGNLSFCSAKKNVSHKNQKLSDEIFDTSWICMGADSTESEKFIESKGIAADDANWWYLNYFIRKNLNSRRLATKTVRKSLFQSNHVLNPKTGRIEFDSLEDSGTQIVFKVRGDKGKDLLFLDRENAVTYLLNRKEIRQMIELGNHKDHWVYDNRKLFLNRNDFRNWVKSEITLH